MKLNVLERLSILPLLPQEGNYLTLKVVRQTQDVLGISSDEFKDFEIHQSEDGSLRWNAKGAEEKDVDVSEKAAEIIKEALEKLNNDGKLKANHFTIYEKFVGVDDGDGFVPVEEAEAK